MPKAPKKNPGIEAQLQELQNLVGKMEDGNLSLDETLAAFEKGVKLTQQAQSNLAEAEQRVQLLLEEDGKPSSSEFIEDDS
jgi:exodeoxyribonuclease VII small subunit